MDGHDDIVQCAAVVGVYYESRLRALYGWVDTLGLGAGAPNAG